MRRVRTAATIAAALASGGCAYGLHPHTTLEGQPFATERLADLREGQSPDEVRALMGAPLETTAAPEGTVWRYYERWNPRGCTSYVLGIFPHGHPPERTVEALVTFQRDAVVHVDVRRLDAR